MGLRRYELSEALGAGGMGAVYAAERLEDGAQLAIKFLSGVRAQEARSRAEFAHEIWSLARLDHPGIVAVVDWGVVESDETAEAYPVLLTGTPYLVMERAAGHLSTSDFPTCWAELVPMVRQILEALAHAHARNVVHRDLKPSNVLRRTASGDHWKLADFGIAHALDRHAADGSWGKTVGTPAYMAPEQILGDWRDFGPWTDLFAVGVLVYELVSGMPPHPELTGKELMAAVVHRRCPVPVPRFAVPQGFEEWLARLLERNFLDRAQRAADVALWLEQLGSPPQDGPGDPGPNELRLLSEGPSSVPLQRRPVPSDWRWLEATSDAPTPHSPNLPRSLQFTGREAERDRLWAALREIDSGGAARAVVIRGPQGSGRTALARWLLERAHELGAAWQLVALHHDPALPLDGIGAMFATFLRSVDLDRPALVERMRQLLQLRKGGGGLEYILTELIAPATDSDDAPVRFGSTLERNAAALGALQVLTGVLGSEADTAPRRVVVALIDDAHLGAEALALVQLALTHRDGLPTPVLFALTADGTPGPYESELLAIEALNGAERIDLAPLPEAVRRALADRMPPPEVETLRSEVGPPVKVDIDALERSIHATISGTSETGDDL